MGYQLVFWEGPSSPDPVAIYETLVAEGRPVDGVPPLPVDEILTRLGEEFPQAVREPRGPTTEWMTWVSDDQKSHFEVVWSDQHLLVEFRPWLVPDLANRVIDVLAECGCPLFDPQTGERFDGGTAAR